MEVDTKPWVSDRAVVGACRLALEASATPHTLRKVLTELLGRAEPTGAGETESVHVLIDAIRAVDGRFEVTDLHPRGKVVPADA